LIQRSHMIGVAAVLLFLSVVLSACGAAPTAQTWPGLTVADGLVYVISGAPQQVYVLDAETGVQQTGFVPSGDFSGVTWWSPVTLGDALAYVGFSEQAKSYGLYAFDPETSQQRWQVPADDLILAAPTYADGVVYFGTSDGSVYAVEAETGVVKPGWSFAAEEAIWGSPLVAAGKVYVPSMDHNLYCLDAETGELLWTFEAGGALAVQPTLEDGILYFGAFDGRVYAIQADSGEPVEGFDFQAGNWIWSEVAVADDQLYVTSLDGKLYALDPSSGVVMPSYPYDAGSPLRAAPVPAGEAVLIASEVGEVTAVRGATAQVLWKWSSEVSILTTPVVWQDMVYVVMTSGQMQTLDAGSGVQGWTFASPASGQ
jgi:outer membrane protein assembly factor BamB